jgi:phage terminase large subunit GpA-like protein
VSVADAGARGIEAVRQDRAVFDLAPSGPRETTIPRPVVFGAPEIALMDLPQLSEQAPAHQPLVAAHAQPWPGTMAVWRSASSDGFELLTTFGGRARLGRLVSEFYAGPISRFDLGNPLIVELSFGTLESVADLALFGGANAPSGLASRPIRILLCDEVDRYPFSAGAEGDLVNLAKKRTVTFWNRKIVLDSTPTIRGASRIETAYAESDQQQYWVPCPTCGTHQVLVWAQVRWDSAAGGHAGGEHRPETARYHCSSCHAAWSDAQRWAAIRRGEWRARAPFRGIAGFHLSEIYSSWVRLEAMVRAFLSARAAGDEAMKTFVNTSLGETWIETGEAPDWRRLSDRRETWKPGAVPSGGVFLTAGADVQKERIEVDVWAWGRGMESWLVEHVVIEGGPEHARAWDQLTALLGRTWPHAGGAELPIARLAIDTGYEAPAVYAWARNQGFAQVAPVKGVDGFNRASPVSGPTYVDATLAGKRLRRGARLWTVAVSTFKAETYRFLRLERPTGEELAAGARFPPGTIHVPEWVDDEWLKQFVAEQLVTVKTKRGFARLEWQKLRERNEALDARVYARAAAWILGADRWSEARWADLEAQLSTVRKATNDSNSAAAPASRVMAARRRTVRSSYMG